MITRDIKKKELVQQLIRDNKISLDEGLVLLKSDSLPVNDFPILQPYIIPQPVFPWTLPYYHPTINTDGTCITLVADGVEITGNVTHYDPTIPFTYTC